MKTKRVHQDQYLKTGAASRYLGVSARTLRNWMEQGRISAKKVGPRTTLFRIRDLDALAGQSENGGGKV